MIDFAHILACIACQCNRDSTKRCKIIIFNSIKDLNVDLFTISKEDLTDNCNKIKNFGLDVCNAIKNSRVIQGMTKEALLLSMGNSENIDETVYKTKTKSYYFYHSYKTRQKKTRYRFRVDLEDSLVVGWKTGKGLD